MKQVTIYTTQTCPYCFAAKELLSNKNVAFEEIDVSGNQAVRDKMTDLAKGRTSVPQIFIDGAHIGDCSELQELEQQGKLNALLG